jgi:16S rRNA (cytidine1402-2'-O)-methyltransferase
MSGELILVATPIGNMGDLAPRAVDVLRDCDVICCEDTRHSAGLLAAANIPAGGRLKALHEHNEAEMAVEVVRWVFDGRRVAIITDAGTPGVSDPGQRVVAAVADAGLIVTTVPGPSAVIAALTVSGLPMERFVMEGFIARSATEKNTQLALWHREPRTIVCYESPQRLLDTLSAIVRIDPTWPIAVCRELTKLHEEVVRGSAIKVLDAFAEREVRGEIVVVLGGHEVVEYVTDDELRVEIASLLASGLSVRDTSRRVADLSGRPHREVYALSLELARDE